MEQPRGTESREPGRVRTMFNGIARRYDFLNHLLSLNQDRRWRRIAARAVVGGRTDRVLDLCGGTGDLSTAIAREGVDGLVICCDFAHEMLALAPPKFRTGGVDGACTVLEADGLRLPFRDGTIDSVGVAFGVRNFADLGEGLREIHRVLAPGGRLVILEFSRPTGRLLAPLYEFYLRRVLPRLGDSISGRAGPYLYLARTIGGFPDAATLAGTIREAGFAACGWEHVTGGIVAVHTAFKATGSVPDLR